MSNKNIFFFERLDQLVQQKHMLFHPFYKAWSSGKLSVGLLKEYAKEYYHHVKAFPTYISALHSRCEDLDIRRELLKNLIGEEDGSPNHPDLWRLFGLALGVSREEMDGHQPKHQTKELVHTFRSSCRSSSLAAGIAVLYCYESQIPAICKAKIDGLKQWYGITKPEDYRYFSVHETADVEHSAAEKQLLISLVDSEEEEKLVLKESEKALDSLQNFLSSFMQSAEMCA